MYTYDINKKMKIVINDDLGLSSPDYGLDNQYNHHTILENGGVKVVKLFHWNLFLTATNINKWRTKLLIITLTHLNLSPDC